MNPFHPNKFLNADKILNRPPRRNYSANNAIIGSANSPPTSRHITRANVEHSIFRPHVPAKDRLLQWTTPHSVNRNLEQLDLFPDEMHQKVLVISLSSLAPNTQKTYAAGLLRFTQFCDKFKVPEDMRMPAPSNLLAIFLANQAAGLVSYDCAHNWMAGLRFWHILHDAPWYGDTDHIRTILKGIRNVTPDKSKRTPRSPVTLNHLHALRHALSTSNPKDVAMLALAETTFWGTCRLGETTVRSRDNFNAKYHVAKNTRIDMGTSRSGVPFISIHIPWSKTSGLSGAEIILTSQDNLSNPTESFLRHRQVNSTVPDCAPLFAFILPDGSWDVWTRESFMKECNIIWARASLECLLGHSFRIGNVTELLLQGFEPSIVCTKGRWKSHASFLRYWRNIQEILPTFLSKDDDVTLKRLRDSFDQFESTCC